MPDDPLMWLMLPLSGSHTHHAPFWMAWHGRLMVLCWGIVLPLGVLVARFFKVTPGQDWPRELDNPFWWKVHLYGQTAAIWVAVLGVALVWGHSLGATSLAQWHRLLGWALMSCGLLVFIFGLARGTKGGATDASPRGDHYDMTFRRIAFERLHKTAGYVALMLSVAVLLLGLWVADAPRWMPLVLVLWWSLWGAAFAVLQRRGRCMDTYQAIWGPGPRHPGNRMPAIGWGISRYTAESFAQRFGNKKDAT